jgi:hypothetical protein
MLGNVNVAGTFSMFGVGQACVNALHILFVAQGYHSTHAVPGQYTSLEYTTLRFMMPNQGLKYPLVPLPEITKFLDGQVVFQVTSQLLCTKNGT